jgi:hypothetical protein
MLQKSNSVRNAIVFFSVMGFSGSLVIGVVLGMRAHKDIFARHAPIMISLFGFFMFVHIAVTLFERKTGRLKDDVSKSWTVRLAYFAVFWFAIGVYALAFLGFYEIYLFAFSPGISKISSIVLVGFATLAIGSMFFLIRLKWRFVYGASEACAGVVVASQRFYTEAIVGHLNSMTPIVLAILTAGVYLVVRGADNMHQGLTKEPLDPIGQKLLKWLGRAGQGKMVQEYLNSPWNFFGQRPGGESVENIFRDKKDKDKDET